MTRVSGVAVVLVSALVGQATWAGGRARYGGTLRVAVVTPAIERQPLLADAPADAAVAALTHQPLCGLGQVSRPSPGLVRLRLPTQLSASSVIRALEGVRAAPSPYRGLLAGVTAMAADSENAVDFQLAWPELAIDQALCHPALSLELGSYQVEGRRLSANPRFVLGRPFPDAVEVSAVDQRGADRVLRERRAHIVLGGSPRDDDARAPTAATRAAPQLFATYLVAAEARADLLRTARQVVDPKSLTRFFVRPPASPLLGLLPPALGNQAPGEAQPAASPPPLESRPTRLDVTLLFDAALSDQRAVAQRLQVKLQPLGYRVALLGLKRSELRARWNAGAYELMLFSVLLPPAPERALEVLASMARLDLGRAVSRAPSGRRESLETELSTALLPLYVQGLAVEASSAVHQLSSDAYGLPTLDSVFLAE